VLSREQMAVRARFIELIASRVHYLPDDHGRLDAPTQQGVYVIYSPRGKVLHVGENAASISPNARLS
jgi:hypothetical protein